MATGDLLKLSVMAADTSPSSRGLLLDRLAESVLESRNPTQTELDLFGEIVVRLLEQVGVEARAEFATRIADDPRIPHDIVTRLAVDVILVASPILRRSPVLTEADLADLAEKLSGLHLVAIAGRDALSLRITDILLRRGDILVFKAVAENVSAQLSAQGTRTLLDTAERDSDVCAQMAGRSDLPARAAERVVLLVAERLRRRIAKPAAAPAPPAKRNKTRNVPVATVVARLSSGQISPDEAVAGLAEDHRHADVAAVLAALCDVDEGQILRVLVRAEANGIITVIRGLGLASDTWSRIVDLRRRRLQLSEAQARFERSDFEKVSVAEAGAMLAQFGGRRPAVAAAR
jgi:hypothetical protein